MHHVRRKTFHQNVATAFVTFASVRAASRSLRAERMESAERGARTHAAGRSILAAERAALSWLAAAGPGCSVRHGLPIHLAALPIAGVCFPCIPRDGYWQSRCRAVDVAASGAQELERAVMVRSGAASCRRLASSSRVDFCVRDTTPYVVDTYTWRGTLYRTVHDMLRGGHA